MYLTDLLEASYHTLSLCGIMLGDNPTEVRRQLTGLKFQYIEEEDGYWDESSENHCPLLLNDNETAELYVSKLEDEYFYDLKLWVIYQIADGPMAYRVILRVRFKDIPYGTLGYIDRWEYNVTKSSKWNINESMLLERDRRFFDKSHVEWFSNYLYHLGIEYWSGVKIYPNIIGHPPGYEIEFYLYPGNKDDNEVEDLYYTYKGLNELIRRLKREDAKEDLAARKLMMLSEAIKSVKK